jgi:hypothetical protein
MASQDRPGLAILVASKKPDDAKDKPAEGDDGKEHLQVAIKSLIKAIKSGDTDTAVAAFEAAVTACKSYDDDDDDEGQEEASPEEE